ncbi:HEPN domain-containing protein [Bacillus altitudinis]|uniref:HEPN domain-containing protein n=1 Tax=Bacillus altitudinis TaxID=293387 RepID=UPI00372B7A38
MNSTIEQFNLIIRDTREISTVYQHFNVPNLDDLLRWQWTQTVSALDKYIHDVIKLGLTMTYSKQLTPTRSYSNLLIPMSITGDPILNYSAFEQYIIQKLSYNSYQTPEKINEGLSLIWSEEHKWQKIANSLGNDKKYLTNKLKLIAQRRNQIVHQGDYPSYNLEKESLTLTEVSDVINFIEKLVFNIHKLLQSDFDNRNLYQKKISNIKNEL